MFAELKRFYRRIKFAFHVHKSFDSINLLLHTDAVPNDIYLLIIENTNKSLYIARVIFDPEELETEKKTALLRFPFAKITLWKFRKWGRDGFIELN